jgi:histidine ammonia-lyase
VEIDGQFLSVAQVQQFLSDDSLTVSLDASARRHMERYQQGVDRLLASGTKMVYGYHTGLGRLKDYTVHAEDQAQFQINILHSHATGIGPYFNDKISRLALLLRANVLSRGHAGVRPELVERLLTLINHQVYPMLRQIGSLGVGDLQPMAQLGLCLTGMPEGELKFADEVGSAPDILRKAGVDPVYFPLARLEALALISGGTVLYAASLLAYHKASRLIDLADAALALNLEALRGEGDAYDPRVHLARGIAGQIHSADLVRRLTRGSQFLGNQLFSTGPRVQDPVSFRSGPQIHGAVRDTLSYVETVLARGLNASTHNPMFFEREDGSFDSLSGGNFHGSLTSYAMDLAAIVMTDLAVLSERRSARLLDPTMSHGLPLNLVAAQQGLNTGFALIQANATALVSEMRVHATPASIGSMPSKNNQEDHNSMGMTAVRKLLRILEGVQMTLAVELLCACQGIDLVRREYPELQLGEGTERIYRRIRQDIPAIFSDVYSGQLLFQMSALMEGNDLLDLLRQL